MADDSNILPQQSPGEQCVMIQGDARAIPLPDSSVHCVVTSPPYWSLRDYGIPPTVWDEDPGPGCYEEFDHIHEWGPQLKRQVHGEDTTGWYTRVAGKGRGAAHMKVANAGRICIHCEAWEGCLGLEPTVDMYVGHICDTFDEVKRVLRPDGLAFLNIGDCYDSKTKQRWLVPHRLALALQDRGWIVRSDIIWAKGISFCPSYAGSVMPESVRDRPTCGHEHILMLAKEAKYFYDYEAVREPGRIPEGTKAARGSGTREGNRRPAAYAVYDGNRNPRDVWAINTKPFKDAHFATFPERLVEPLVRAGAGPLVCASCGTPYAHRVVRSPIPDAVRVQMEGSRLLTAERTGRTDGYTQCKSNHKRTILSDTYVPGCNCQDIGGVEGEGSTLQTPGHGPESALVLDPFAGSGTVGVVCKRIGRRFVGIEPNPAYLQLANKRLAG